MPVMAIPYLTHYGKHGIIPVRQDINNLDVHLARRRALYRHLGIEPLTFRNRRVLEFGPGTGDNALYIAACEPQMCVLVDANPASLQAIAEKVACGLLPRDQFETCMSEIRAYTDSRRFDVVLCEGVLPGQEAAREFLAHVASFADVDGLVVITTMSPVSVLAEVCRRVIKAVFSQRVEGWEDLITALVKFFEPDLRTLPGMSRLHEDWVLDNILHPWPRWCIFTIPEAIETLDAEFDIVGTSPRFIQDWRWYKAIPGSRKSTNAAACDEHARWAPYLVDYRVQPDVPLPGLTAELDVACKRAVEMHDEIWYNNAVEEIPRFAECIREVGEMVAAPLPQTGVAIADFLEGLKVLLGGDDDADFGTFRSWFGRGQQYASFVRR